MRKSIIAAAALLAALAAYAAPPADNVVAVPTPPTGACRADQTLVLAKSSGHVYGCVSGSWYDWTAAAALAAVNVNSITGNLAVTGVVKAAGGVDLNGDGTPELTTGTTPEGGGGSAPSVVLRGASGSPALSFYAGHLDLDTPLRVPSLDLTGDGTDDLTTDGSGHVQISGWQEQNVPLVACDTGGALAGRLVGLIGAATDCSLVNYAYFGAVRYDQSTNGDAFVTLAPPTRWTGRLLVTTWWRTGTATTGVVRWNAFYGCTASSFAQDATITFAPVVYANATVPAAAKAFAVTTFDIAATCPAGSVLVLHLGRSSSDAADTAADYSYIHFVRVAWERK